MLKKFLFAFLFFFVFSLKAQSPHPTNVYFHNSRIFISPWGYHLRLKTLRPNATTLIGNEKLNGFLGGGVAGYDYKKLDSLYLGLRGSYGLGKISGSSVRRFIHEWMAEARLGYNYVALQGVSLIATFYLGYGFNHMIHSRSSGGGFPPIKLKYYEYYVPVGLMFDWKIVDYFHLLFDFTWMPSVDPTVRIGGIAGSRQELKHKQNFRVEVPLSFYLGRRNNWEISLVPFWKRWVDGRTRISSVGDLSTSIPQQVLMYWGSMFLFGYHF